MALPKHVSVLLLLLIISQLSAVHCQYDNLTKEECRQMAWDCNLACQNSICPGKIVWTLSEDGICIVVTNECFFRSRICSALLLDQKPPKRVTKEECSPHCSTCQDDSNPTPLCATNGHEFVVLPGDCGIDRHSCENGEYWRQTLMIDCD